MGITIHYKGSINKPEETGTLISELSDIAYEMSWEYSVFNDNDLKLRGIFIQPHSKTETLSFLINKDGGLTNPVYLMDKDDHRIDYSYISIKTQFAPVDIHITIVKLLKYIRDKYIINLEVFDEGCYWETGDAKLLSDKFDFLNGKINLIASAIQDIPRNVNETPESIADKIEKLFKEKFK